MKIFDKPFKSVESTSIPEEEQLSKEAAQTADKTAKVVQKQAGSTPTKPSKVTTKVPASSLLSKITAPFISLANTAKVAVQKRQSREMPSIEMMTQKPEPAKVDSLQQQQMPPQINKKLFAPSIVEQELLTCLRTTPKKFIELYKEFSTSQKNATLPAILLKLKENPDWLQYMPQDLLANDQAKADLLDIILKFSDTEFEKVEKCLPKKLKQEIEIRKAVQQAENNPGIIENLKPEIRNAQFYGELIERAKNKTTSHYANLYAQLPEEVRKQHNLKPPQEIKNPRTISFVGGALADFTCEAIFIQRNAFLEAAFSFAEQMGQKNIEFNPGEMPVHHESNRNRATDLVVIDLVLTGLSNPAFLAKEIAQQKDSTLMKDLLLVADYMTAPSVFASLDKESTLKLLELAEKLGLPRVFQANILANHRLTPEFLKDEALFKKFAPHITQMGDCVDWKDGVLLRQILSQCPNLKELTFTTSRGIPVDFLLPSSVEKLTANIRCVVEKVGANRQTPLQIAVPESGLLGDVSISTAFKGEVPKHVTLIVDEAVDKIFEKVVI